MIIYGYWCVTHQRTGDEDTCLLIPPLTNTCHMVSATLVVNGDEEE
jgi:hypothetical protein